jgi:Protein kinase domain
MIRFVGKILIGERYERGDLVGSGGMADVFLAHDNTLDRDVALKVMSTRYASDEEFVERFKREAQSAAALSHPNIVSIFDSGVSEDGTYYIAMEYLPGGTLKDRITRGARYPTSVQPSETSKTRPAGSRRRSRTRYRVCPSTPCEWDEVSGNTATATVDVSFVDNTGTMPRFLIVWGLVKEGGQWELDEQYSRQRIG